MTEPPRDDWDARAEAERLDREGLARAGPRAWPKPSTSRAGPTGWPTWKRGSPPGCATGGRRRDGALARSRPAEARSARRARVAA